MPPEPTKPAPVQLVTERIAKHIDLLQKLTHAELSPAERQAKFYADNPDLRPMTDDDIPF